MPAYDRMNTKPYLIHYYHCRHLPLYIIKKQKISEEMLKPVGLEPVTYQDSILSSFPIHIAETWDYETKKTP